MCLADPWFPDEINDGHAEYLFYLLSGMMGVFFLGYLVAAKLYRYKEFDTVPDLEQEQSIKETVSQPTSQAEKNSSDTGF